MKCFYATIALLALTLPSFASSIAGVYAALPFEADHEAALRTDLATALIQNDGAATINEHFDSVEVSGGDDGFIVTVRGRDGKILRQKKVVARRAVVRDHETYSWSGTYDMSHEGTRSRGTWTRTLSKEGGDERRKAEPTPEGN
jgi:hypothetical protein